MSRTCCDNHLGTDLCQTVLESVVDSPLYDLANTSSQWVHLCLSVSAIEVMAILGS